MSSDNQVERLYIKVSFIYTYLYENQLIIIILIIGHAWIQGLLLTALLLL